MATPAEMAALERERIRQDAQSSRLRYETTTLSFEDALDFYTKRGQTAERRSATSMREVSDLEQLRAKLSADGFTKALGSVGPLLQRVAAGQGGNQDWLKFVAKMKELQLEAAKSLGQKDEAALQRWTMQATASEGPGASKATVDAAIANVAIPELLADTNNPNLVGTVNALSTLAIPAEQQDAYAKLKAMADDRRDQITDLSGLAASVTNGIGNLEGMGAGAQAAAVKTFIDGVGGEKLNEFAVKAGRLPNPELLDQAILDKKTEAQVAKDAVDEYLKMDPFSLAAKFEGGAAKAKDNERLRVLSSEKFQKWAASNGLRVGSVRPATSEADKNLPGYIPSTNSVYVAGAEDDRALGIATKQATMKPSQMLIPRRGLETRKYVEATVGGTAQPGLTGFTKVAFDDKAQKAVFIRADGSAVAEDGGSYDTELAAKLTSQPLAGEQLQKVNDDMAKTLTTTGGGQKIRGVETALMWSDPPDAIMAVETPEGKRVIIRKQDEKNINVLSGGKERKDGVIRSLLAKARERIARPGEDKLRAADEAAMSKVDKAREAELETKRQAEQAAKPDRMQPAAAKAAVETAVEEAPTPRKEAPETMTTGDIGRAKALVGLGEKTGADIELQRLARRARGAEAYTTSDPNLYRSTMLQLGQEAEDFLRKRRIPYDTALVAEGAEPPDKDTEFLKDLAKPPTSVTPTSTAGKEVREASGVDLNGGNAPQVSGVATGTPASAPAVPAQNDESRRIAALRDARLKRQQYEREVSTLGGGTTR